MNNPLIISHRGDLNTAVENTILACESSINLGANALEIDIRSCGSGEIVVFHDFSLKRMFNQPGYVGRISLNELKKFPYVSDSLPVTQYIETLDEFLDRFGNRIPINIDAKTIHFFDFTFADKINSILKNHRLTDSVWVSCFNPFLLQILKAKNSNIKTGYLFQRMTWAHTTYDVFAWSDAWHPRLDVLNERLMEKAIKKKKEIYVWTINSDEDLNYVSNFEVHGIISDNVKKINKYFQNNEPDKEQKA